MDCEIFGCKYKSPFSLALEANDEKTALRLLKRDSAGVLSSSDAFGSALHCAARFGAAVACGKLVRRGADPNETWVDARETVRTPLLIAAERAHHDVVQVLLAAGANARWHSHQTLDCVTALHVASSSAVVRLLVANGGDVNYACPSFVSGYGVAPVLPPLAHAQSFDVFAALLDAGAVPDAADKRGWTELHRRASTNDRRAIQLLLRRAVWSQVALDQALAVASFNGSTDAVALLLVFGASANDVAERSDKAPIVLARNEVVAALLLADGARQSSRFSPSSTKTAEARKILARYRLRELVAEGAGEICIGLQPLELPAFVTLQIVDQACGFASVVSMFDKWRLITKVKHFPRVDDDSWVSAESDDD
jgi:ankyrin repeat protein